MLTYNDVTQSFADNKAVIGLQKVCLQTVNGNIPIHGVSNFTDAVGTSSLFVVPLTGSYIQVQPTDTIVILP